jgi:mono/diheme cytochrome c family protein
MHRPCIAFVASAFLAALWCGPAHAADTDLAAAGKALVQKYCARCHAVDKNDTSKLPLAPPFRDFARKWPVESLEEALAEGIVTGHPDMPVVEFEPDQIAAIIEHLHEISGNAAKQAR